MKKLNEHFNAISVKKGEYFAVELKEPAAAGYLWNFNVTAGAATVIRKETADLHPRKPGREMPVGGPVLARTIFRAEEAGVIEVQANLQRPWEKGTPPAQSHHFKIDVK